MRFERLELSAFGRFTDRTLDFGDGRRDFHLIFGPNEAGKSTTLAAIADLLYGIEERSAYGFLHGYRDMLLAATIADANNGRLSFRRRKGRSNTLLDETGSAIDDARLEAFRCQADRAFFTGMFALDHVRLRQGGETILSARGDLGQSLFQAGAAVRNLHGVLGRLDSEAGSLFAPRGQNPRINARLAAYKDARGRIAQNILKGDTWKQARDEVEGLETRQAEINRHRGELQSSQARLDRIRRMLPLLARHDALATELDGLADAPRLSADAAEQRRTAQGLLAQFHHAGLEAKRRVEALTERRGKISVDGALLAALTTVGRLQRDLGAVAKALEDLPAKAAELAQVEQDIAGVLRDLGRNVAVTEAAGVLPTGPTIAVLRTLITEEATLSAQGRQAADTAKDAESALCRLKAEIDRMPPARDALPVRECLKEATRHGRLDELLAEAEDALEVHHDAIAAAIAALPGWSGTVEELARLAVPEVETVRDAEHRLNAAAQRVEQCDETLAEARAENARRQAELTALTRFGTVATEEAVHQARAHRDDGWRLIRRRFVEGLAADDAAFTGGASLPDAYERAVADADALADRVKDEAERAARHRHAVEQQHLAEHNLKEAEARASAVAVALTVENTAWAALWQASGLAPDHPRMMQGFLTARRDILARYAQAASTRQTTSRYRRHLEENGRKLEAALLAVGEAAQGLDFAALLSRAETVSAGIERDAVERQALTAKYADARHALDQAMERREAAVAASTGWRTRWTAALGALELNSSTTPAEAEAMLSLYEILALKVPQAASLRHRIEAMQDDVNAFTCEVDGLVGKIAPDLTGKKALDALPILAERVQKARDADREVHELGAQIAEAERARQDAEGEEQIAATTLDRLCRQAGCERPDGLEEAERRASRRQAVELELEEHKRIILDAGEGLGFEELRTEANSIDRDRIVADLEALKGDVVALDAEMEGLLSDLARHKLALAGMSGESAAAEAAEQAEHVAAELRDDVGRYVRLRFGHAILRHAVERFRQRHQGPLMARAAELFRQLTLGAFAGLDTGFDDHDEPILLAVRAGGGKVAVDGLSEGTRDQLFLALRLAAIDLHLAAGRQLPFIADDLFIHFDDERAAAALAVLADLATRTQVMFFTHNRHMVDLAEQHLPPERFFVTTL